MDARGQAHLKALPREKRAILVLEDLLAYNADVVCVQECEASLFHELFQPQLALAGYQGVLHQRGQATAYELKEWAASRTDGCATFWKTSKCAVCLLSSPCSLT